MRHRNGVPAPTLLALGIAGILALPCAHAQQAPVAADAYHDRIIAPQQLQDLPPDDEEADLDGRLPQPVLCDAGDVLLFRSDLCQIDFTQLRAAGDFVTI